MGNGFPTQSIPPEKFPYLFIFATGTGIAPIKALIESGDLQVWPGAYLILDACADSGSLCSICMVIAAPHRQTSGR